MGLRLTLGALRGVVLGTALSALACAPQEIPFLLEVDDAGPGILEPGDELEVLGSGFPEGREGWVTLKGTVYAPGHEPRSLEAELRGRAESRSKILAAIPARQLSSLTDGAPHATFRGQVEVSFTPIQVSGPELRGESPDVIVDLFSRERGVEKAEANSVGFAEYLGVSFSRDLRVQTLVPGSEAEKAGLMIGDQLRALDSVRLDAPDDFSPRAFVETSRIEVVRPGRDGVSEIVVDRASFQPLAAESAQRALTWLLGLLFALVLVARPSRLFLWRLTQREKFVRKEIVFGAPGPWIRNALFFVVLLVLWSSMVAPLGALSRVDLLVFLGLYNGIALVAGVLLHGRSAGGFSVSRGIGGIPSAFVLSLPLGLALLERTLEAGTFSAADLSRLQAAAPLGLGLLESPWALGLGLVSFLASVPELAAPKKGSEGGSPFGSSLAWLRLIFAAGLWVVLFLGGGASEGVSLGAGLVFSAKITVVVGFSLFLRRSLGPLPGKILSRWLGARLLGLTIGLLALGLGVAWSGLADRWFELLGLSACLLFFALGILLVWSRIRLLSSFGRALDPWI